MSLIRITQPSTEPVALADVKAQLSIATADTLVDAIITRRITEARQWAENYMGRTIMPSQWEIVLDEFADKIQIYYPPATVVDSIKYIDLDGVEQTLSSSVYTLDTDSVPNWVRLGYEQEWPETRDYPNAVRIRYTAGYANAASVPGPIKEAIMLIIGHWMRYQGAVEAGVNITRIPNAVECLLTPYKVFSF